MKSIAQTIGITLLTAVTAIAPLTTTAYAGDGRWNKHSYQRQNDSSRITNYREYSDRRQQRQDHRVRRHGNDKDAIALGIIGLGVGAIIGGAIANGNNNPRVIYRQQPSAPQTVNRGSYEPWSQSWFRFCSNKYRSFNASTGTFRGYDGRDHFCVAN